MTTNDGSLPIFATNNPRTGETVAASINQMLGIVRSQFADAPPLAIATAYLNPQGFGLIADEVEQAPHVRILLGAEPEEPFRTRIERGTLKSFDEVAALHDSSMRRDRDLLGFDVQSDGAARRLVTWLRSVEKETEPRVEVRRFTKGFMHGKAFIANHPVLPAVLAGSSNLTYAGLSVNRELNLGYPVGTKTDLVVNWFDELWDESEPYPLADLYEARWLPHSPMTVFLRMLHELYGGQINHLFDSSIELPATEFQRDGIFRALRILEELNGVLVCDEVGLGKTFIAGEIIRRTSVVDRQKVLVVVPAALKKSTWEPFLNKFDLTSNRVSVVTFDELRIGKTAAVQNLDDYALVIIDEAHNLRNPNAQKAQKVLELLHDRNPKKVVLLTATPVNNSLWDLHTLINYFVSNDAQFTAVGIPSIREYIKSAQQMDPESLSPEHLFDLMDQVAVRRTRKFIKAEYKNDQILNNRNELVPIVFPTPVIKRVDYDLDSAAAAIADKVIYALKVSDAENLVVRSGSKRDPKRLSMARYAPSVYTIGNEIDRLEIQNVGLLRSALLKRLESSSIALERTLQRLVLAHQAFLSALDEGKVLSGKALKEYGLNQFDNIDEFLDSLDEKASDQVSEASEYDVVALRTDVVADLALLEQLHVETRLRANGSPDAKVIELLNQIIEIAESAERPDKDGVDEGDRRKVIIFSTYTDTIEMLREKVVEAIDAASADSALASYKGRVAPAVFGSYGLTDQEDRARAIAQFCPKTAGELKDDGTPKSEDKFDLMFTTDVLAEGVNLQQAGRMINFDLPWNPMKLVQRHGRIDRIGSPHSRVFIGVFFPAKNLDEMLGLEATLQRKIALANAAVGSVTVLGDDQLVAPIEILHHDNRGAILEIFEGNARLLLEGGGNEALSGEEFRRRLNRAMGNPATERTVLDLPYGAGSGFVTDRVRQAGYVFCVRIGDHPTPWFRFIAADAETWTTLERPAGPVTQGEEVQEWVPWIETDTLTSLMAADPRHPDVEQQLSDAASQQVFDAWAKVRAEIHETWTRLTDPAFLAPKVDLALRQAIDLVFAHGTVLGVGQQTLIAKLSGKWNKAVVDAVRAIVRNEELLPAEKVIQLDALATEMGLQIPAAPQPLPSVRIDDIRVVCWMAVTPKPQAD
jgi:ERCC4-related helicase